jgi:SNF2 family DNA or RNA helicase
MLQHVKKLALPDLPPITHHQVKCQLNNPSQAYYNHHFSKFLTNFDNPKTKGRIIKENNFFSQLQSLRGICDHPLLANPNMTLTEEGNFNSDSVSQNQPPSSNKNYHRIEHKVSYEVCCQSRKIVQLCQMVTPGSPLMAEHNKAVIFSIWERFLDL